MAEFPNYCIRLSFVVETLHLILNSLQIKSQEEDFSEHYREFELNITLINWNDEFPIFNMSEYYIEIEETFPANEILTTITATDRDIDDRVM